MQWGKNNLMTYTSAPTHCILNTHVLILWCLPSLVLQLLITGTWTQRKLQQPVFSDGHGVDRDRLPRDVRVEVLSFSGREESGQVGLCTHESTVKVCASHVNL